MKDKIDKAIDKLKDAQYALEDAKEIGKFQKEDISSIDYTIDDIKGIIKDLKNCFEL